MQKTLDNLRKLNLEVINLRSDYTHYARRRIQSGKKSQGRLRMRDPRYLLATQRQLTEAMMRRKWHQDADSDSESRRRYERKQTMDKVEPIAM